MSAIGLSRENVLGWKFEPGQKNNSRWKSEVEQGRAAKLLP